MCSISYARQAKIVSLIELVSSVLGFGFVSIPTLALWANPDMRKYLIDEDPNGFFAIFFQFSLPEKVTSVAIPIIYFLGEFVLAILLYSAVTCRNYAHLRIWFIVTVTICMTALYFFLPGVFFTDDSLYFIAVFIGSYAFTAYSVWVVYSFMKELRSEGLHFPIATWQEDKDKF